MKLGNFLGVFLILQFFGIPLAVIKAFLDLVEGYPKYALVQIVDVFLNFATWLTVTVPDRFIADPLSGTGFLIGEVSVLLMGMWLLRRKPRMERSKG